MNKYDVNTLITSDSTKYNKDCKDFCCLRDGTILGDSKYCDLSKFCIQADYVNGVAVPMENHYCPVIDPKTNKVVEWDYYCTGKHDHRSYEERIDGDDKAS